MSSNISSSTVLPRLPIPEPLTSNASTATLLAQDSLPILQQAHLLTGDDPNERNSLEKVLSRINPSEPSKDERTAGIVLSERVGLTILEVMMLKQIFKNWRLCPGFQLLHLFELELYSQISCLKSFLDKENTLSDLSSIFFNIRNRRERDKLVQEVWPLSQYTDDYFPPVDLSCKELIELKKNLSSQLDAQQQQMEQRSAKVSNPARLRKLQENLKQQYDANNLVLKRIQMTINIFLKVLDAKDNLLIRCVHNFKEDEHPQTQNTKSELEIWTLLSDYAQFCSLIRSDVLPKIPPLFTKLGALCDDLRKSPFTKNHVHTFQASVYELSSKLMKLHCDLSSLRTQVQQGSLDAESLEHHLAVHTQSLEFLTFASQFQGIFEQLAILAFPDFCPIDVCIERCIINVLCCPTTLPHNEPILDPVTLPEKFQNYFCTFIASIEEECFPLLGPVNKLGEPMPDDPQIACIEYFHPSGGHAARGNLATVLFRCAPEYKKFLRRINDEAVDFSAKLAQFFKDQVQALPAPLSETQRQKIASDIQVIYWEKTLFLRRMVMLSEDILAIVEGMTGLDQYIPWELTDIIAPDKLYALLGSPSVEAVEIPSKEEVVFENNEHTLDLLLEAFPPHDEPAELDLNQLAVEDFVQPEMSPGANRGEEKQAALRDIAAIILTKKAVDDEKEEPIKKIMGPNAVMSRASSAVRPQSVGQKKPERPSYSIASPAILKMTKTRHILTALRECGFTQIRSTGPHLVLTDDFGRNVVVPKRRVQKVGTVYGIYAQATALIRKLK